MLTNRHLVHQNATNATLCPHGWFWALGAKTRFLGVRRNNDEQIVTFFLGKEFRCFPGVRPYYSADFRPIGRNFDPDMMVTHKSKIQKMRFFSIFSKFVLDDSRYQIRLPNHSRTPKMSFSGHISIFRTISATLKKIDFRIWKIPKVPMCGFCHFLQYEAISCITWPKIWNMSWNVFSRSQRYFWIPRMQAFNV